MRRRDFIKATVCAVTAWPMATLAQQSGLPVIGYLNSGSPESDAPRLTGLRRGLNQTGYVEGRNFVIEYRWTGNQPDRLSGLATDLVRLQVTAIVAAGALSALAAKAATASIPIVFIVAADPVQLGLVASINRPGGNLTGFNDFAREVAAKGLAVLHELLPSIATVGFLENPNNPVHELTTRDVLAAAAVAGLKVQILNASTDREIDAAFMSLVQARTGGLLVANDPFFNMITGVQAAALSRGLQMVTLFASTEGGIDAAIAGCVQMQAEALLIQPDVLFLQRREQIAALALRHRLPAIYAIRDFPQAGGLMSYGSSFEDAHRLAGVYAGRILKGEKPADMPVIQGTKFDFVINLKTAKAIGLTIPPGILSIADEVIE